MRKLWEIIRRKSQDGRNCLLTKFWDVSRVQSRRKLCKQMNEIRSGLHVLALFTNTELGLI